MSKFGTILVEDYEIVNSRQLKADKIQKIADNLQGAAYLLTVGRLDPDKYLHQAADDLRKLIYE